MRCLLYSIAVFFPKDASNLGAFTKKRQCFLDLTIGRLANLGAAHGCSLQTCSPKCAKAVQQGKYPEIAEKVPYATWTSQRFDGMGKPVPHLTKPIPLSVFLPLPPSQTKNTAFFFSSDSMMQLLNWSLGTRAFLMILWDDFCSALLSMR